MSVLSGGQTMEQQHCFWSTANTFLAFPHCSFSLLWLVYDTGWILADVLASLINLALFSTCLSLSQCDGLKGELVELQHLYNSSQRERAALEQELQRCKAELQKLVGRKSQVRGQRSIGSGALVNGEVFYSSLLTFWFYTLVLWVSGNSACIQTQLRVKTKEK